MKTKLSMTVFLFSISAHSFAEDYTGTIKQVVCHVHEISSVCHVSVNGTPPPLACALQGMWRYSFDGTTAEGKNILSILLAAQLARQTVTIGGKGACTLIGGTEDLRYVYITTP